MEAQLTNNDSAWVGHKLADGMSAEQIEEYLKDVVEVEKKVYIDQNLSIRMKFAYPKEPVPPSPPKEAINYHNVLSFILSLLNEFVVCVVADIMIGITLFVVLSILLVLIFAFAFEYPSSWHMLCNAVKILAVVIGVGWITVSAYKALTATLKGRKKYIEEQKSHEKSMRDYSKKQMQWKYQVSLWQQECKQIKLTLETSQENQAKIYAIGVLAPKYRNFAAVCSLLEYFQAGTCETMKEAYNKYDQELLLGHIINNLGKISRSLGEIKQNQLMLYSTLQSSNYLLDQLIRQSGDFYAQASQRLINMEQTTSNMNAQISEILQTSAITAYCSDEAQKELSFMRRMSQYNGIIGNSWPV